MSFSPIAPLSAKSTAEQIYSQLQDTPPPLLAEAIAKEESFIPEPPAILANTTKQHIDAIVTKRIKFLSHIFLDHYLKKSTIEGFQYTDVITELLNVATLVQSRDTRWELCIGMLKKSLEIAKSLDSYLCYSRQEIAQLLLESIAKVLASYGHHEAPSSANIDFIMHEFARQFPSQNYTNHFIARERMTLIIHFLQIYASSQAPATFQSKRRKLEPGDDSCDLLQILHQNKKELIKNLCIELSKSLMEKIKIKLKPLLQNLCASMESLQEGQALMLPTGFFSLPYSHAIACIIEKKREDLFDVCLVNTGSGIFFHDIITTENFTENLGQDYKILPSKHVIRPILRFMNIPKDHLFCCEGDVPIFFEKLLIFNTAEYYIHSQPPVQTNKALASVDLFYKTIGGYLSPYAEREVESERPIRYPQESGTCVWNALKVFVEYILGGKENANHHMLRLSYTALALGKKTILPLLRLLPEKELFYVQILSQCTKEFLGTQYYKELQALGQGNEMAASTGQLLKLHNFLEQHLETLRVAKHQSLALQGPLRPLCPDTKMLFLPPSLRNRYVEACGLLPNSVSIGLPSLPFLSLLNLDTSEDAVHEGLTAIVDALAKLKPHYLPQSSYETSSSMITCHRALEYILALPMQIKEEDNAEEYLMLLCSAVEFLMSLNHCPPSLRFAAAWKAYLIGWQLCNKLYPHLLAHLPLDDMTLTQQTSQINICCDDSIACEKIKECMVFVAEHNQSLSLSSTPLFKNIDNLRMDIHPNLLTSEHPDATLSLYLSMFEESATLKELMIEKAEGDSISTAIALQLMKYLYEDFDRESGVLQKAGLGAITTLKTLALFIVKAAACKPFNKQSLKKATFSFVADQRLITFRMEERTPFPEILTDRLSYYDYSFHPNADEIEKALLKQVYIDEKIKFSWASGSTSERRKQILNFIDYIRKISTGVQDHQHCYKNLSILFEASLYPRSCYTLAFHYLNFIEPKDFWSCTTTQNTFSTFLFYIAPWNRLGDNFLAELSSNESLRMLVQSFFAASLETFEDITTIMSKIHFLNVAQLINHALSPQPLIPQLEPFIQELYNKDPSSFHSQLLKLYLYKLEQSPSEKHMFLLLKLLVKKNYFNSKLQAQISQALQHFSDFISEKTVIDAITDDLLSTVKVIATDVTKIFYSKEFLGYSIETKDKVLWFSLLASSTYSIDGGRIIECIEEDDDVSLDDHDFIRWLRYHYDTLSIEINDTTALIKADCTTTRISLTNGETLVSYDIDAGSLIPACYKNQSWLYITKDILKEESNTYDPRSPLLKNHLIEDDKLLAISYLPFAQQKIYHLLFTVNEEVEAILAIDSDNKPSLLLESKDGCLSIKDLHSGKIYHPIDSTTAFCKALAPISAIWHSLEGDSFIEFIDENRRSISFKVEDQASTISFQGMHLCSPLPYWFPLEIKGMAFSSIDEPSKTKIIMPVQLAESLAWTKEDTPLEMPLPLLCLFQTEGRSIKAVSVIDELYLCYLKILQRHPGSFSAIHSLFSKNKELSHPDVIDLGRKIFINLKSHSQAFGLCKDAAVLFLLKLYIFLCNYDSDEEGDTEGMEPIYTQYKVGANIPSPYQISHVEERLLLHYAVKKSNKSPLWRRWIKVIDSEEARLCYDRRINVVNTFNGFSIPKIDIIDVLAFVANEMPLLQGSFKATLDTIIECLQQKKRMQLSSTLFHLIETIAYNPSDIHAKILTAIIISPTLFDFFDLSTRRYDPSLVASLMSPASISMINQALGEWKPASLEGVISSTAAEHLFGCKGYKVVIGSGSQRTLTIKIPTAASLQLRELPLELLSNSASICAATRKLAAVFRQIFPAKEEQNSIHRADDCCSDTILLTLSNLKTAFERQLTTLKEAIVDYPKRLLLLLQDKKISAAGIHLAKLNGVSAEIDNLVQAFLTADVEHYLLQFDLVIALQNVTIQEKKELFIPLHHLIEDFLCYTLLLKQTRRLIEEKSVDAANLLQKTLSWISLNKKERLVFAYFADIELRPEQTAMLDALEAILSSDKPFAAMQGMMGLGKSCVVIPIILQSLASQGRPLIVMTPTPRKQQLICQIKSSLHAIASYAVEELHIDRAQLTTSYLKLVQDKIEKSKKNRVILVMTPQSMDCLLLQYQILLYSEQDADTTQYLRSILRTLRYSGTCIVDEFSHVADVTKATNFPLQLSSERPPPVPSSHVAFIQKFFSHILSKDHGKAITYETCGLTSSTISHVIAEIKEDILSLLEPLFPVELAREPLSMFLNNPSPDRAAIENFKAALDSDSQQLLGLAHMLLHHLLIKVLSKSADRHFGRSLSDQLGGKIIPYKGARAPSSTDFSCPYETICFHFLYAAQKGVCPQQVEHLFVKTYEKATLTADATGCAVNDTDAAKQWQALTGISLLDYKKKRHVITDQIIKTLEEQRQKGDFSAIFSFESCTIEDFVCFSSQYLSSSCHSLFSSFHSLAGLTGTPWNHSTYSLSFQENGLLLQPEVEEGICKAFIQQSPLDGMGSYAIACHTLDIEAILETVLLKLGPQRSAKVYGIIDAGGLFKDYSCQILASKLLSALRKSREGLNEIAIIYFDKEKTLAGSNQPVLLRWASDEDSVVEKELDNLQQKTLASEEILGKSFFLFFDEENAYGIDAYLPDDAICLITAGKDTRLDEFSQGLFRMRSFGKGQKAITILSKQLIEASPGLAICPQTLLAKLQDNSLRQLQSLRKHSIYQEIKSILRSELIELSLHYTGFNPMKIAAELFIERQDSDLLLQSKKLSDSCYHWHLWLKEEVDKLLSLTAAALLECKEISKDQALKKHKMMQERCSLLMQKAKDLPLSSENLAITLELFIQRQQQNEQHIQQEIIGNSLIEPASISKDIIAIDPLAVIRHFLATSEPFINGQLCIKPVSLWKIDADERSPIQALDSLYLSNNLICNKTNLATHQKKLAAFAVFIKKDAHECVALGLSSEEMIDFLGALSEEDLQGVALFSLKGTSLTGRCKTHLIDQNFLQKLCFEGHIFNEDLKELAKEGQAARLWLEEGPQNSTDPVNLKPQTIENILLRPCYQKAKEILKSRLLPPYEEDLLQKEVERVERALIMINSGKESLAETEIRHLSKRSIQSLPVHLTPYIPCSMVPLLQTVEQIQRLSEKQLPYLSSKTLAEHYPDLEKTWSFIRNRSYAKRRSPQMQELQARLLPLSFKQMQSLVQALEAEEDEKTIAFSPAN